MLSPAEYKKKYLNLEVAFDDGPVTIQVRQYIEFKAARPWTLEADRLVDSAAGNLRDRQKKDPSFKLTLKVNGKPVSFTKADVLSRSMHYAFEGKGSPEDCQVAAQMAVLQKRIKKAELQSYCDKNMGLDCNGFVGNYLWYEFGVSGSKTWPGENPVVNYTIDEILHLTKPLSRLDTLVRGNLHVFGLLDGRNRIVPRDGAAHAHIGITEPGIFTDFSFLINSIPFLDTVPVFEGVGGAGGYPSLWCVESTAGLGLYESWYVLSEVLDSKKKAIGVVDSKPGFKVFSVYRSCKHEKLNFTIGYLKPAA